MAESGLLLSALIVVGPRRQRGQRAIDALVAQTRIDAMEIVVVDVAPAGTPPLVVPREVHSVYLSHPELQSFARARLEGLRRARAPIVAFIEDHCFAQPQWAEALIEAHRGPWIGVGYAFLSANPRHYVSRGCLVAEYGVYAHPIRSGCSPRLASNNVSYKRAAVMAMDQGEWLAQALDVNIQDALTRSGQPMFLEARALVAHQNYSNLGDLLDANFAHCRLLAANRAALQGWSVGRRFGLGVVVPLVVPPLRFLRMLASFRSRSHLWPQLLVTLPIVLSTLYWSAIGEAIGYVWGYGDSERRFLQVELEVDRGPAMST